MRDSVGIIQGVEAWVERKRPQGSLRTAGRFKVQQVRDGKIIQELEFSNGVVNEGKNMMLDVMFGGATASDPWYIGLIDSSPVPSLLDTDTLASHTGWNETNPYAGNRIAWDENAAGTTTDGEMDSASASAFTINATDTVAGIMICDQLTGDVGTLWATGLFDENLSVVSGDTINVTYATDLNS